MFETVRPAINLRWGSGGDGGIGYDGPQFVQLRMRSHVLRFVCLHGSAPCRCNYSSSRPFPWARDGAAMGRGSWERMRWPDAKFEMTSANSDLRNEQQREKREESREKRAETRYNTS